MTVMLEVMEVRIEFYTLPFSISKLVIMSDENLMPHEIPSRCEALMWGKENGK